ncbi:MAG: hypothetical protein ACI3W5_02275 [Faecousia sp.]
MPLEGTIIEFVPIFDGEQTLNDLLTAMIVDRIMCKKKENALPKEPRIGYNVSSVPLSSEAPGPCDGVT